MTTGPLIMPLPAFFAWNRHSEDGPTGTDERILAGARKPGSAGFGGQAFTGSFFFVSV
jgi:hypothetical protein